MIKLGIITANHFPRLGGMEFAVHNLAVALQQLNGVSVAVACSTMPEVPKNFKYTYPCYRSKSFSYVTPWLFTQNQKKMIQKEQIDILHGPMLHGGGYWALEQGKRFGIPVIAHSHGSDVQTVQAIGYGALLNANFKPTILRVLHESDHLIAVSSMNKEKMVGLGADPDKISVVHNGIAIEAINKIPVNNKRSDFGLGSYDFVLLTVGRNRPIKRMELLFQALAKLKEYKEIKCLCVGPETDLKELINRYKVQDKVVLTGRIPKHNSLNQIPPFEDLINIYRTVDVYVSTSYIEAFGIAAADALACGKPVVIGRFHGVRDILREGETGWVMQQETPEELAEIILELYQSREILKAKEGAIQSSVSHLSWGQIAKQTLDIYNEFL